MEKSIKSEAPKSGIELISEKQARARAKGRTVSSDAYNNWNNQLGKAAALLLCNSEDDDLRVPVLYELAQAELFGWDMGLFKSMLAKPYRERTLIAGSLIASELDRFIYNDQQRENMDEQQREYDNQMKLKDQIRKAVVLDNEETAVEDLVIITQEYADKLAIGFGLWLNRQPSFETIGVPGKVLLERYKQYILEK